MAQKIDADAGRFRQIVRGKIKSQLKGYISNGEMIGKKGRDLVSIPVLNTSVLLVAHQPRQVDLGQVHVV